MKPIISANYNSVGKKVLYDYMGDRNAEADTIEVLLEYSCGTIMIRYSM